MAETASRLAPIPYAPQVSCGRLPSVVSGIGDCSARAAPDWVDLGRCRRDVRSATLSFRWRPNTLGGRPRRPRSRAGTRMPTARYSLSFGYYNRNTTEVLSIPIGPDNFDVSPGDANQGQPTYFYPRRHWGVFAVKVPADFRRQESRLDAEGSRPDVRHSGQSARRVADRRARGRSRVEQHAAGAQFAAGGPEARGPGGITVDRTASVGKPLTLERRRRRTTVRISPDGRMPGDAHLVHASRARRR